MLTYNSIKQWRKNNPSSFEILTLLCLLVCFLFQQQNLQTHVNKYDPDGSPHFFFLSDFQFSAHGFICLFCVGSKQKQYKIFQFQTVFCLPEASHRDWWGCWTCTHIKQKTSPKQLLASGFISTLCTSACTKMLSTLHIYMITRWQLLACTFVASAVVSPQDNEVGRVRHASLMEVVLLHLQPMSLARFVNTLSQKRKLLLSYFMRFIVPDGNIFPWEFGSLSPRKTSSHTRRTPTNLNWFLCWQNFHWILPGHFFFPHGCFNINMPWVGQGYSSVNHESQDSWLDICRFVHQQE